MLVHSSMPDEVSRAYEVWRLAGRRNYAETGRLCGIPRSTVHAWSEKYRWLDQAAVDDASGRRDAIAGAEARAIADLALCDEVRRTALRSRIGPDGTPYSTDDAGRRVDAPAPAAIRTMFGIYDRIGFAPQRRLAIDVTHSAPALGIDDATLDRLLAEGNVNALLALNAGADPRVVLGIEGDTVAIPPPGTTTLPPDFTNSHPGGRDGSEPSSLVTKDSVFEAEIIDLAAMRAQDGNEGE